MGIDNNYNVIKKKIKDFLFENNIIYNEKINFNDNSNLYVFFRKQAYQYMLEHCNSDLSNEVGGVLAGNAYIDPETELKYVYIEAGVEAKFSEKSAAQMRFTGRTWEYIFSELDEKYNNLVLVGWYHTHPGLSVFMSGNDKYIQNKFFNYFWQVAVVVDSVANRIGLFYGPKSQPNNNLFIISDNKIEEKDFEIEAYNESERIIQRQRYNKTSQPKNVINKDKWEIRKGNDSSSRTRGIIRKILLTFSLILFVMVIGISILIMTEINKLHTNQVEELENTIKGLKIENKLLLEEMQDLIKESNEEEAGFQNNLEFKSFNRFPNIWGTTRIVDPNLLSFYDMKVNENLGEKNIIEVVGKIFGLPSINNISSPKDVIIVKISAVIFDNTGNIKWEQNLYPMGLCIKENDKKEFVLTKENNSETPIEQSDNIIIIAYIEGVMTEDKNITIGSIDKSILGLYEGELDTLINKIEVQLDADKEVD